MAFIRENVNLLPYNTFKIQASAKYFTVINSVEEASALLETRIFNSEKKLFLGGGSNLLFTENFEGLVIKNEIRGIEMIMEDDEHIALKVGAGENWHEFVLYCVNRNYGGIENLSLIPGTVGAAPMQNIGAYGVEVMEVIQTVDAIHLATRSLRTFTNEACRFGYRESIFKHEAKDQYLITHVTFRLTKKNHRYNTVYGAINDTLKLMNVADLSVKAISDAVILIRQSKLPDPAVIGNAGSFFKNPTIPEALHASLRHDYPTLPGYPAEPGMIKVPAAWLIEQSGWKGKKVDNIGVHQFQALVLVNYGGGEGKKIWQLALDIQASVRDKFNITLQPEVNII